MAVDVSNLVNMLATQPGQQVAGIGQSLLAAQEGVRQREQQEFENNIATTKQQLETALANQKISMNEVEMVGKRGELIAQTAQGILSSPDPLIRQQLLQTSAPVLMKAGVTQEQIQEGLQNIDNPQFWNSVQAMGVGANQYWKEKTSAAAIPKAPTTRKIQRGKEMVAEEWNPETREWAEVGRGPMGRGSTFNINTGKKNWESVFDRYEKTMKSIVNKRATVEEIKIAANTEGGASAQALQTSIADLFGGQSRAIAELERWGTFGNLPDRVINSASKFFTGEYSEAAKADVLRLLRAYQVHGLNKEHEAINEKFAKTAEKLEVPRDVYEREVPEIRDLDFSEMTVEDISNIDPNTLELDEQQALSDRLTELGY